LKKSFVASGTVNGKTSVERSQRGWNGAFIGQKQALLVAALPIYPVGKTNATIILSTATGCRGAICGLLPKPELERVVGNSEAEFAAGSH
jgi:hypothetical protein